MTLTIVDLIVGLIPVLAFIAVITVSVALIVVHRRDDLDHPLHAEIGTRIVLNGELK